MADDHGSVAAKRRVRVGHHPDQPLAAGTVRFEREGNRVLMAGAKGAGSVGIILDRKPRGGKGKGTLQPFAGDDDPSSGQRVEAKLAHTGFTSSTVPPVAPAPCAPLPGKAWANWGHMSRRLD